MDEIKPVKDSDFGRSSNPQGQKSFCPSSGISTNPDPSTPLLPSPAAYIRLSRAGKGHAYRFRDGAIILDKYGNTCLAAEPISATKNEDETPLFGKGKVKK